MHPHVFILLNSIGDSIRDSDFTTSAAGSSTSVLMPNSSTFHNMHAFITFTPFNTSSRKTTCLRKCAVARCVASASLDRRHFNTLLLTLLSTTAVPIRTLAFTLDRTESDSSYGYSFQVPSVGWTRTIAGLSSFRQAIIYVCDDDRDSNISMVSTPIPGDYQKLTSFGNLDNVVNTLVPRKGKDIDGRVIATRVDTENNAYVIEYAIESMGVKRHLLTVFALQPGKWLLTLTAQAREENWGKRGELFKAVADSFQLGVVA